MTPPSDDNVRSRPVVKGNILKGFEDFYLKAKNRIWPLLSYSCHIPTTLPPETTPAPDPQQTPNSNP